MHNYLICGLSVASELVLPGAVRQPGSTTAVDVHVRRGAAPATLGDNAEHGPNWEMDGGVCLLRVPRLARLLIVDGREIVVELEPGASGHDASAHVLGTALGILLHQRGTLVLHGAAVARNNEAIAICGHSGAGKSTLAAALCREGAAFVADDICAIGFDDNHRPFALPDGRQLKLWRETVENLGFDAKPGDAVRTGFEKYFITPPSSVAREPLPLRAIYVLKQALPPAKKGIEVMSLADAMAALDREAYRPGLRARMGSASAVVAQGAMIMTHARMFRLVRPHGFESMAETVAAVVRHWDGLAR